MTPRIPLPLLAALLIPLAACDGLLDVEAASRIPASALDDPTQAALLVNGAIADFECAFGAYVVLGGLVGEELVDATQTADRWPYDRRDVQPGDARYGSSACTALGVYTPLSTARWAAESILQKLGGWSDAQVSATDPGLRALLMAQAAAYSGYSHLLLGEGFCSGVLLDEQLEPGDEATRTAVLERALLRFGEALGTARQVGNADLVNLALVGQARALLDLGRKAEAGSAARQVPPSYLKTTYAATTFTRLENRVVAENNRSETVSVGPAYRDLNDLRVPVSGTGRVATDGTPIWVQAKYASLQTGLPLATGDEAQLIFAEASGGQVAVDILNALRQRAGLSPWSGGDGAAIQRQIVEERRRELFLESHHLGDVFRYDLQLTPAAGTTFAKGGLYGSTKCLPLPDVERLNNPKIGT